MTAYLRKDDNVALLDEGAVTLWVGPHAGIDLPSTLQRAFGHAMMVQAVVSLPVILLAVPSHALKRVATPICQAPAFYVASALGAASKLQRSAWYQPSCEMLVVSFLLVSTSEYLPQPKAQSTTSPPQ